MKVFNLTRELILFLNCVGAGKSARSVKSASMFGISDLANVTSSKKKKAPAASPSVSAPKASIRGKGKKRKTSDELQGFPLLRQQFLDYVNEVRITAPVGYLVSFEDHLIPSLSLFLLFAETC